MQMGCNGNGNKCRTNQPTSKEMNIKEKLVKQSAQFEFFLLEDKTLITDAHILFSAFSLSTYTRHGAQK